MKVYHNSIQMEHISLRQFRIRILNWEGDSERHLKEGGILKYAIFEQTNRLLYFNHYHVPSTKILISNRFSFWPLSIFHLGILSRSTTDEEIIQRKASFLWYCIAGINHFVKYLLRDSRCVVVIKHGICVFLSNNFQSLLWVNSYLYRTKVTHRQNDYENKENFSNRSVFPGCPMMMIKIIIIIMKSVFGDA